MTGTVPATSPALPVVDREMILKLPAAKAAPGLLILKIVFDASVNVPFVTFSAGVPEAYVNATVPVLVKKFPRIVAVEVLLLNVWLELSAKTEVNPATSNTAPPVSSINGELEMEAFPVSANCPALIVVRPV